jgi:hypothetical protein
MYVRAGCPPRLGQHQVGLKCILVQANISWLSINTHQQTQGDVEVTFPGNKKVKAKPGEAFKAVAAKAKYSPNYGCGTRALFMCVPGFEMMYERIACRQQHSSGHTDGRS